VRLTECQSVGQIVLDTDVVSHYYKRRLPAEVQQHLVGQRTSIALATAEAARGTPAPAAGER
jgi:hypothetical protein